MKACAENGQLMKEAVFNSTRAFPAVRPAATSGTVSPANSVVEWWAQRNQIVTNLNTTYVKKELFCNYER